LGVNKFWRQPLAWLLMLLGFKSKSITQDMLHIDHPVQLTRYCNFPSTFVSSRNIEIWLPPSYNSSVEKKFPVLYWQDGQNLFDPAVSYNHSPLEMHKSIEDLVSAQMIQDFIVVGIWNNENRFLEYMPDLFYNALKVNKRNALTKEYGGKPLGDKYLQFLTQELKPYIDSNYRTLPDKLNCYIGGASMGGLISFYGLMEYPHFFGGAICMSTHWPISVRRNDRDIPEGYFHVIEESRDKLKGAKLYFDHGTENLDAWYSPYQLKVDEILFSVFQGSAQYLSLKFEGKSHSEKDWRDRLEIPLEFMLSTKRM